MRILEHIDVKQSWTVLFVFVPKDQAERIEVGHPRTYRTQTYYYSDGCESTDAWLDMKKDIEEAKEAAAHRPDIARFSVVDCADAWSARRACDPEQIDAQNERLRKKLARLTARQYERGQW